jgi:DNA-binding NtrC family response regulator
VFVVDGEATRRDVCEAILARLQFAVAPFESPERALAVIAGFRPDVVVADKRFADAMRLRVHTGRDGEPIPIVVIPTGLESPEPLLDAIRAALRRS